MLTSAGATEKPARARDLRRPADAAGPAGARPRHQPAIPQRVQIALLPNRLNDARRWLERAIALRPGDTDPKVMLAEAYYRLDDFEKAAAALSGVDVSANQLIISQYPTLNVATLRSFQGQTPYEVQGGLAK